jgi:hypothetical protein
VLVAGGLSDPFLGLTRKVVELVAHLV